MLPSYYKEGNKLHLLFDYSKEIVDHIKENFSYSERKWDAIGKQWIISSSITNQNKIKSLLEKYDFKPSDRLSQKSNIESYLKDKSRLDQLKSFKNDIDQISSNIKPYPYQVEGINAMCSWSRMINGDDMGTGKSVQTIFSAEVMDRFPCLLVCPSSTKYQWKELWSKVNKDRTISIIEAGNKEKDWTTDVVIINYDILGEKEYFINKDGETEWRAKCKYKELQSIDWNYVVYDEIHMIKNYKSLRGKTARLITKNVENVHGLTGTLIENKPVELVNPLMLIGVFNEVFGSWNNFTGRYCDAKETRYGLDVSGASNTVELNRLLRETCYIRREKRDVLKDLPPIQTSILDIEISNTREYKKAEDSFIEYMTENFSKMRVESAMMAEFLVQRNQLRQLSLKGKIKGIESWLEDYMEQTKEKALIVGNFSEPLQVLSINFDSDLIDGSKNALQKREAIKRWNSNKNKQFLFGNINAIGTGTDGLQDECSVLIIIDLPDKPSTLAQLIGRLERIGQKNSISVYYTLSHKTIDMKIWDAIEEKRKITDAVNKGIETSTTNKSIDDLLIKSYLESK
jgi:SWI/SNF-related matrix-associated actin-dependent regulator 1 of chromatin subfamily A